MLVLSRKVGERIVIGEGEDQIVLVVVDIKGGRIRLGIEAGDHIHILRGELHLDAA
ncbi:MAG: carbon storage regulator [Planctomycetota bacterium]